MLFWLTAIVIIAIHELGHGFTCKHFGGQVHEIGAMLIYFQPAFFCNVNDAWTFPELRARLNPQQNATDILTTRMTQLVAGPISSAVGKVVQETFGVETFQLTPSFINNSDLPASGLNPTARLTIGKRISDRAYLTFSRSLASAINDQVLLLEYDATEKWSWILSRNEDRQTYALEFRVRHAF